MNLALIVMLLVASPATGQVAGEAMRPLMTDVEKGLRQEVDKALNSPLGQRVRDALTDMLGGATVSEVVAKQLHSTAVALTIQRAFLPAFDSSLTVASRGVLRSELSGPVTLLVGRYAAEGMAAHCRQNERDCVCLAGSDLAQKIADDLLAGLKERPFAWLSILNAAGTEAILAKLIVRLSVFLATELVDGSTWMIRNGQAPSSFCASLQGGGTRLGPPQISQALDKSLGLGSPAQ